MTPDRSAIGLLDAPGDAAQRLSSRSRAIAVSARGAGVASHVAAIPGSLIVRSGRICRLSCSTTLHEYPRAGLSDRESRELRRNLSDRPECAARFDVSCGEALPPACRIHRFRVDLEFGQDERRIRQRGRITGVVTHGVVPIVLFSNALRDRRSRFRSASACSARGLRSPARRAVIHARRNVLHDQGCERQSHALVDRDDGFHSGSVVPIGAVSEQLLDLRRCRVDPDLKFTAQSVARPPPVRLPTRSAAHIPMSNLPSAAS